MDVLLLLLLETPVHANNEGVITFVRLECKLFLGLDTLLLQFLDFLGKYCCGVNSGVDAIGLVGTRRGLNIAQ